MCCMTRGLFFLLLLLRRRRRRIVGKGMTDPVPAPREIAGPTSPQSGLLGAGQRYLLFPRFTLESGVELTDVPVAFQTWGQLAPGSGDNALVVCHALTGSADVEDWWGPLLGKDKLFDPSRFFVVCCNVLGSPYGSASSCTFKDGETSRLNGSSGGGSASDWQGEGWWGPEFPATTVRDDVRIQKEVLEYLGVQSVAAVVGGSMGGMAVLEWPLVFPTRWPEQQQQQQGRPQERYIQAIVPIATSARHSAWCISWAEAQRQSIYSDPLFKHGYYSPDQPPRNGLSAARMAALLTYRSRDSFESRFGRRVGKNLRQGTAAASALPDATVTQQSQARDRERRQSLAQHAADAHNEGNLSPRVQPDATTTNGHTAELRPTATTPPLTPLPTTDNEPPPAPPTGRLIEAFSPSSASPQIFSAQSYLRYQGDKFVKRFDANCYIHLTRKMDSHDVARRRWAWNVHSGTREQGTQPLTMEDEDQALTNVLDFLSTPTPTPSHQPLLLPAAPAVLIVSIESDGLFAPPEQILLHNLIQGSHFVSVKSTDGHDGFLLEFEQINTYVGQFLQQHLAFIYARPPTGVSSSTAAPSAAAPAGIKESVFGEVEDVTRW